MNVKILTHFLQLRELRLEPLDLPDVALVLLFQQLDADHLLAAVARGGDGGAEERHLGAHVIDDVSARAHLEEVLMRSGMAALHAALEVGLLCLEEGDLKGREKACY